MKRIDIITDRIHARMSKYGTFGCQVYVDKNNYAYFRDPDHIMGKLTFKAPYAQTDAYQDLTERLSAGLRAEIRRRLLMPRIHTHMDMDGISQWMLYHSNYKDSRRAELRTFYTTK